MNLNRLFESSVFQVIDSSMGSSSVTRGVKLSVVAQNNMALNGVVFRSVLIKLCGLNTEISLGLLTTLQLQRLHIVI